MRYFLVFAALALALAGLATRMVDNAVRTPSPQLAAAVATPAAPASSSNYRTVTIPRDARGHFQVEGRVDGRRIGFMVDTGASVIALTASEAGRLGIHPSQNDYIAQSAPPTAR